MIKAVYIHIPFCKNICSYCDFCKFYYQEKMVDEYLDALEQEIKEIYKQDLVETLYIGGGTPSVLNIKQLEKLFYILKNTLNLKKIKEFTIEINPEDITEEKLKLFVENKVNRISVGHQTKHTKYLKQLNRPTKLEENQMSLIKKYFTNINLDLMYGFENQTLEDLDEDIEYLISLKPTHISTYSLILEEHTRMYLEKYNRLEEETDAIFYENIQSKLKENGYNQYEISNFSKINKESKHNLTYWNNEKYYGFGLGASGYIENIRYTNTRSIKHYLEGKRRIEIEEITKKIKMIYEMILGLRKTEGVSKRGFSTKFGCNIEQTFDIMKIMEQGWLEEVDGYIRIPKKYLYRENQILLHFLEVKNEE